MAAKKYFALAYEQMNSYSLWADEFLLSFHFDIYMENKNSVKRGKDGKGAILVRGTIQSQ